MFMNDTATPTTPQGTQPRSREKTAWWITFGVLSAAILAMLGLWN